MEHTHSRHDGWRLAPDEQFKMTQVRRTSYASGEPVDVVITGITAYTGRDNNVSWSLNGVRILKSGKPGKKAWTGYFGLSTPDEFLDQIPDEIRAAIALDGLELPRAKA